MIGVVPAIVGVQMLLNFLSFDVANSPRIPLQVRSGATDEG